MLRVACKSLPRAHKLWRLVVLLDLSELINSAHNKLARSAEGHQHTTPIAHIKLTVSKKDFICSVQRKAIGLYMDLMKRGIPCEIFCPSASEKAARAGSQAAVPARLQ